jgi:hypothetical protein
MSCLQWLKSRHETRQGKMHDTWYCSTSYLSAHSGPRSPIDRSQAWSSFRWRAYVDCSEACCWADFKLPTKLDRSDQGYNDRMVDVPYWHVADSFDGLAAYPLLAVRPTLTTMAQRMPYGWLEPMTRHNNIILAATMAL